jgi:hypothetical protein
MERIAQPRQGRKRMTDPFIALTVADDMEAARPFFRP